ncbi:hypothetical protein COEREDRAFT_83173 [Coemansia reversa NRRL 1564]|uniref:MIT domain-containing protein n=1 Tax=Coemansia reversa (strain ATCC 12441 / NRRL 1564) TaxID=763665 RepID=A0A2G5B4F9_COERN|nr:hypothetical protein COEREDRAFT_83173 [Coemansia reversa NRRL 1564]|eukprot:PIA13886.1 hypothetical protein COEREDRAFT_83173 [Coemansia reversa NRRL 1564]
MSATPMRLSPAGMDQPLELADLSQADARRETEGSQHSPEVASGEHGNGGNNTRSFRFLLTLALRKAQTAVTLDNGGHVDEAIRTYREAISMLGLVLNRTNEEDGRQRLLHFRQTYSDRVSVLSSLRPSISVSAAASFTTAHSDQEPLHQQSYALSSTMQPGSPTARDNDANTEDLQTKAAQIWDQSAVDQHPADTTGDGNAIDGSETQYKMSSTAISPLPIPDRLQGSNVAGGSTTSTSPPIKGNVMLTMELPTVLDIDTHKDELVLPMDINKPLPAMSDEVDITSNALQLNTEQDVNGSSIGAQSHTQQVELAKDSVDADSVEIGSTDAQADDKTLKRKGKGKSKDSEKPGRRQSIKSQRSLPAMFGMGSKPKSENKSAPPVPPILTSDHGAQKLGRRLLGALRSDHNSSKTSASKECSEDAGQLAAQIVDTTVEISNVSQQQQSIEDNAVIHGSEHAASASSDDEDIPPPTPAKDSPPTPVKPSVQTLTREQKRQSNAAHRLAGLFKRKPSIPEIPSPALPQKYTGDSGKAGAVMGHSPQPTNMFSKDRRLSASASTPNLFEAAAAAAAASSDQPALAVFAATERGVLPPMPAPPPLRPSISASGQPVGSDDEADITDEFPERVSESAVRAERNGSISDVVSTQSTGVLRIKDNRPLLQQKQSQQQNSRPSLRIATKSAAEVLKFVPEDGPLPSAPVITGVDDGYRSRKSSINTTASHPLARSSGNGLAPNQQLYGRPTLFDVEEDQRSEMLDPAFDTFHADLGPPPPKSSPLSAVWFMNTLHRSMASNGAYLTPNMFISRRLWFQTGIRITAIEAKLGVLSQLTQSFTSIGTHLALPNIDALMASAVTVYDDRRAETVPWESEDNRGRSNQEKDDLHRSCVALHHWLNNLEETLDSSRRLLSKKLKFVNQLANATSGGSTSVSGLPPLPPAAPATASNDNFQASMSHAAFIPAYDGPHDGANAANASFPNLTLSNSDIPSNDGVPVSPLSPGGDPIDSRFSEAVLTEAPSSGAINGSMGSTLNPNRDTLNKDQMSNSRFKGFGKLGKSVDRLYSNIQKEKLDDTSAYVAALQRLFEAAMVLESIMHYFSRVSSDPEMASWFTDIPQSPVSMTGKRPQHRGHRGSGSINTVSPSLPQATLASEPSMSSMNSASDRKSSNASVSVANMAADKKNRRRSNYFSQRQNSNGMVESIDSMPAMTPATKPRGESVSMIPRLIPAVPAPTSTTNGSSVSARFVLAQSPIKNPSSYVHQGKGRAPGIIYARLVRVTEWLNQVLLAWVVRDIQVLYAKYIKRLREWVIE